MKKSHHAAHQSRDIGREKGSNQEKEFISSGLKRDGWRCRGLNRHALSSRCARRFLLHDTPITDRQHSHDAGPATPQTQSIIATAPLSALPFATSTNIHPPSYVSPVNTRLRNEHRAVVSASVLQWLAGVPRCAVHSNLSIPSHHLFANAPYYRRTALPGSRSLAAVRLTRTACTVGPFRLDPFAARRQARISMADGRRGNLLLTTFDFPGRAPSLWFIVNVSHGLSILYSLLSQLKASSRLICARLGTL